MTEHQTKNGRPAAHMEAFYRPFQEVKDQKFDGLIITGAPIEHLPFEAVTYWGELREVMDWTQTNVHSTFGVVLGGGMAMINHFHGVRNTHAEGQGLRLLPPSEPVPDLALSARFSDDFVIPVSRWTEMQQAEIDAAPGLRPFLARRGGPVWWRMRGTAPSTSSTTSNMNSDTLKQEYDRDVANGTADQCAPDYYRTMIRASRR